MGAGPLAPLRRRWGVLFDVTPSGAEGYSKWDDEPGAGPGDNLARLRHIPCFRRSWECGRHQRFSVYAGFGPGCENNRESHRPRPIMAWDERGRPVLAERF